MPELTRGLLMQALEEWGRYRDVFGQLPASAQASFLREEGYASCSALLAHVAAWWEETPAQLAAAMKNQPAPVKQYSFDKFNAAAVERFKDMPEPEFIKWFEGQRREMEAAVGAMSDEQLKKPRVAGWLDGVVLEHLKEHCVGAPRFLAIDILQREWADYPGKFGALPPEKQAAFLKKQGFARFRDLAAHVIAWWQQGIQSIESSAQGDVADVSDVDGFNAEAVTRFGRLQPEEVLSEYEQTRLTLVSLIDSLPEPVYSQPNVQGWLRADVLAHYYDHAL
jgi:hypothetical protein